VVERPTAYWREQVVEEKAGLASGTLDPDDAFAVDARHDGPYETGEREQLCEYIESALERAGIDVDAFAARHRITRHEITDEWRDW
jgi:hypothetical protein